MVSAMSSGSEPISSAWTVSAINSPAFTPTIPAPSSRRDSGSNSSFVIPSSRPSDRARPDAAHGNTALLKLDPLLLRGRLGQPHPRDLRIGIRHRRDRPGVELHVVPGDHLGRDLALVRGLVRE